MRLILQPDGSSLCGQACVAMVAGVSLEESVSVFGHRRGTYTRDIVGALEALGVRCSTRLNRISRARPVIPHRSIVAIVKYSSGAKRRQRFAHWMVSWDGVIYDPGGCWPEYYKERGWEITSYLELE